MTTPTQAPAANVLDPSCDDLPVGVAIDMWSMDDVDLLAAWIDEGDENTNDDTAIHHADRSSTAIPTTSTPVDSNPTRLRRNKEVAYLKDRAAELEAELAQLRASAEADDRDTKGLTVSTPWKPIAQRQQIARERSQLENQKLRAMLASQIKLAQTLERLLHKRSHTQVRASSR
jgi:hypothetical protein